MAAVLGALVAATACTACTDLSMYQAGTPPLPWLDEASRWSSATDEVVLSASEGGQLSISTTLPAEASPGPDDRDEDGLSDAWEDSILDRLRPVIHLADSEPMLEDLQGRVEFMGRLTRGPEPGSYRAFVGIGWEIDYGRCSVAGHRGDVERVVYALEEDGPGLLRVVAVYTAGHEYTSFDSSTVFGEADLGELELVIDPVTTQPRLAVYSSSGKHATYASRSRCERSDFPCAREDCESGEDLLLLPELENVGEPDSTGAGCQDPLDDRFPECSGLERFAWEGRPFCGFAYISYGDAGNCAPPAREKLVKDPFEVGHPDI
jgi:hypothetical protein